MVKMEKGKVLFFLSSSFLALPLHPCKKVTTILHPLKLLKNCAGVNTFIPIYSLIPPDLPLKKGGTFTAPRDKKGTDLFLSGFPLKTLRE
ncbi:MAG: hypothetical protein WA162_09235 [Thermodesulfobacteriota bacterium]